MLLRIREVAARGGRGEDLLEVVGGADVEIQVLIRPVDARHVLRAAARREILEVDDVAHVEEVVGPAGRPSGVCSQSTPVCPAPWRNTTGYGDLICLGTMTSKYMAPPMVGSFIGPISPTYWPPA
jgi:hypothetical protein